MCLYVVCGDAVPGSRAPDLGDVDPYFPGQPAHGRGRGHQLRGRRCIGPGRRRGCGSRSGGRRLLLCRGGGSRRFRRGFRGGSAAFDGEDQLPDRSLVPFAHVDCGDLAGEGGRHLHDTLVDLDLQHRIVDGDVAACRNEHGDDVPALDPLTERRQGYLDRAGSRRFPASRGRWLCCRWGRRFGLSHPRFRLLRAAAGLSFDRQDDLAHRRGIPFGHHDLGNGTTHRGGDLDDRLVGLELDDRLVLLEGVADGNEDIDYLSRFDVFPEVGELEFGRHQLTRLPGSVFPDRRRGPSSPWQPQAPRSRPRRPGPSGPTGRCSGPSTSKKSRRA